MLGSVVNGPGAQPYYQNLLQPQPQPQLQWQPQQQQQQQQYASPPGMASPQTLSPYASERPPAGDTHAREEAPCSAFCPVAMSCGLGRAEKKSREGTAWQQSKA